MTAAAQSLYSVINETYEEEWLHPDSVETALKVGKVVGFGHV